MKLTSSFCKIINKNISPIGFGTAGLSGSNGGYGFGSISKKESINILNEAFHLGINIFDTAPVYGLNNAEKVLSEFIKTEREKKIVISKGGIDWHENKRINLCNSPRTIKKMIENSLKNLDSYIDIYMIHYPDDRNDIRFALEVLVDYKNKGLINNIGVSNPSSDDLKKAQKQFNLNIFQFERNIFKPKFIDEISDHIEVENNFFTTWGTFDKGILTGSVYKDRKYEKCDARSFAPWWKKYPLNKKLHLQKILTTELYKINLSLREFALHFALSNIQNNSLNIPLIGFRKLEHIEFIKNFFKLKIPKDLIDNFIPYIEDQINV